MADAGGSYVEAGIAAAALAMQATAITAQAAGTAMKIEEAIGDYNQTIADIQARSADASAEAKRKVKATTREGVLELKEQGAQAAFESRMAMTSAEMTASQQEARLGASGVRAKGSPLMAAQQNVDLAFAAADRTVERGNAGMALGGLRLGNTLADITGQETLLTKEYGRQTAEATRKRDELKANKNAMIGIAALGGLPGLASSFYNYGTDLGWFGS